MDHRNLQDTRKSIWHCIKRITYYYQVIFTPGMQAQFIIQHHPNRIKIKKHMITLVSSDTTQQTFMIKTLNKL